MRAKEFIELNKENIEYLVDVQRTITDLLPLRLDKEATDRYFNMHLSADIRRRDFTFRLELYEQGNVMQKEYPELEDIVEEIPVEKATKVREQLFKIIETDESFGYLLFLLGMEQNAKKSQNPIDCLPDENRIKKCILRYRDDYPKQSLDEYLNDDLNYQQYDKMTSMYNVDDDEAFFLEFFNRAFEIYDRLRLCKQSVSETRHYLHSLIFSNDRLRYWTFDLIEQLIDTYECEDVMLRRCRKEIEKIIQDERSLILGEKEIKKQTKSRVRLNAKRGTKLDFIRLMNCAYEMGLFEDLNGGKLTKKEFFTTIGQTVNLDLSNYDKDLSRALSDNTALEKHLRIFDELRVKMEEIFNSK